MPRILRIINRFNLGGPTHNAAYLSRYLPQGFETLLVGGPHGDNEESSRHILDALGVEARVLPEMCREVSPWQDRRAYRRIKRIIREFRPDVVHTHAAKAGAVGRLAASDLGVKAVVHTFHGHVFHSYFGPMRTSVFKSVERYLAHRTSRIIAISDKQRQELVDEHRICTADKVTVIPLGFDLGRFAEDQPRKRELFRRTYGVAEDELAIGIIGRLVPVKNHALFLRAVQHVRRNSDRKVRAFIVGDGEERSRLENLAREAGLDLASAPAFNGRGFGHGLNGSPMVPRADVTFTSWIKEIDIACAGLDLVALTSFNEGTPVSLIEAQAAGKAVVSTRTGGIEDVVLEGRTGLLAPVQDEAAFAANLLRAVEDDGLRHSLADAGRDHVRHRYHYTRLVHETADLYTALLA
jgi:glycosyltransferase involved in cell wall biosynthesis